MPNVKVIDYDHTARGTTCNGIISAVEGGTAVEAIWTYERDGQVTTQVDRPAAAVLAAMWSRIAGSMARRGVFWRHRVVDPTRMADPEATHLIVAVVEQGGELGSYTFAVPADEADPEFTDWLELLAAPGGHRRPEPAV